MAQPATDMVFVRHGETAWNTVRRLQGWTDTALNERGEAQAAAAAEELTSGRWGDFDAVYSSDLKRAVSTGQFTASKLGKAIVTDARLREHNLGVLQGMTFAEAQNMFPTEVESYFSDPDYVIPKGESQRQKSARVVAAMNDLAAKHVGQRVLVFTHGGVLDCVHQYVTNGRSSGPRANCCISLVRCTTPVRAHAPASATSSWAILEWAYVEHLNSAATKALALPTSAEEARKKGIGAPSSEDGTPSSENRTALPTPEVRSGAGGAGSGDNDEASAASAK